MRNLHRKYTAISSKILAGAIAVNATRWIFHRRSSDFFFLPFFSLPHAHSRQVHRKRDSEAVKSVTGAADIFSNFFHDRVSPVINIVDCPDNELTFAIVRGPLINLYGVYLHGTTSLVKTWQQFLLRIKRAIPYFPWFIYWYWNFCYSFRLRRTISVNWKTGIEGILCPLVP